MSTSAEDQVRIAMAKAADPEVPRAEKLAAIDSVLRNLTSMKADIDRSVALVTNIRAYYDTGTPTERWSRAGEGGALDGPGAGSLVGYNRRERTMQLVNEALLRGERRVSTERIAEALRREGDENSEKLQTAIGNILAHAGWRRVGSGLYEAAPAAQEGISIDA